MHKRAEFYAHIQQTTSQYHLRQPVSRIAKPQDCRGLIERFDHRCVPQNMAVDVSLIDCSAPLLADLARYRADRPWA